MVTRVPNGKDFRWLFDSAVDAMLLVDASGTILACNPSAQHMFGYAQEDWPGLAVEALVPERLRAAHRHHRAYFNQAPVPRAMGAGRDLFGRRKDGSEFPIKVSLSVLPSANGGLTLAIIEDLSTLRAVQDELSTRTREFSQCDVVLDLAVGALGVAPWEWDSATDTVSLSPQFKEQIGLGASDSLVLGTELRALIHPDDAAAIDSVVNEFRAGTRQQMTCRFRLRQPDGGYRWYESRGVRLKQGDTGAERVLGLQWDVTEELQVAQQQAIWRAEVEQVRQLKVAFETAAAIAHDINQPLNAVLAFSEAAQIMLDKGQTDKLAKAVAGVAEQTQRAGEVLRDLMHFLEQRELPSHPIDLNRVVREAAALVTPDEYPGTWVAVDPAPGLPQIIANEVEIKRVVLTLLRNGAEACAGRPSLIAVQIREQGDMALVRVHDSGAGLDPEAAKRLFEPFFTTKVHGIGMGLATSRRIIERHGGEIWVETCEGGGATFKFTLPLKR